jgi:DNA-binding CsgD family transcriptional regulator
MWCMSEDAQTLLATGERALAEGDWVQATRAFRAVLEIESSAAALDGLGDGRFWLGDHREGVALREQAYAAYLRDGEHERAVDVALWLCRIHAANFGNDAAAAGWLARARRLVDEHGLASRLPQVLLHEAFATPDPSEGEALVRKAYELSQDAGDADLQLCALSQLGAALIEQGRIAEGVDYLDEAMAGSLGGEGSHRDTVVFTSCTTMISCTTCAEFERAVQWIRATDRYARRFGSPFLYVECRTLYAAILIAIGNWVQAEDELTAALEVSRDAMPALHHQALAALAGLRLDQGRLEEAERLVAGLEDQPAAVGAIARIHLRRGRAATAETALRRCLAEVGGEKLASLPLWELLGEAELAQDRPDAALEVVRRLAGLGEAQDCAIATARAARLEGRAREAAEGARDHLGTALATFTRLGMPLEAARTRLLLAESLREVASEVAVDEARVSLTAFEALGAAHDADRAAGLLRDLGVSASRTRPKGLQPLTNREQEVLGLLGEGLTNADIAERLYISPRTVEQHVARVLAKLGLNNRTEAAAEAVRQGMTGARR